MFAPKRRNRDEIKEMSEFFADIFTWLEALPPLMAYGIIFIIAYGENVMPPIPGDMVIVFGGYLAGIGQLNFFLVWILSVAGGVLGFMSMYALGRRMGVAIYDPERFKWLPKRHLEKTRAWVSRWGYGVVAANRFLSGARSVISLTVGMARKNAFNTMVFSAISAIAWTGLIIYGGYAIGENWQIVGDYIRTWGVIIIALMTIGAVAIIIRKFLRSRVTRLSSGPK